MTDVEQAIREIVSENIESEIEQWIDSNLTNFVVEEIKEFFRYDSTIEDTTLEAIENALEDFPDDPNIRCSLGRAFTNAIRSVLQDEVTKRVLSEIFAEQMQDPDFIADLIVKAIKKGN